MQNAIGVVFTIVPRPPPNSAAVETPQKMGHLVLEDIPLHRDARIEYKPLRLIYTAIVHDDKCPSLSQGPGAVHESGITGKPNSLWVTRVMEFFLLDITGKIDINGVGLPVVPKVNYLMMKVVSVSLPFKKQLRIRNVLDISIPLKLNSWAKQSPGVEPKVIHSDKNLILKQPATDVSPVVGLIELPKHSPYFQRNCNGSICGWGAAATAT